MATLVLTTVGGLVGGPIGAALGAVLGQTVDREILFRPENREGPRLKELKVQTSSYGTQIPKLFGTMRVAGTVIWSTDLIETRSEEEGGKGAPDVTRYRYSASFAVLLSARPIRGVRRIWADGNLLRGAAGDFKSETGFRLHPGGEDQGPDPLIAAAEGSAVAPAHRGAAYAVFENMALGEFGNRIPSLTFEVEADEGPVDLGMVARAVAPVPVTVEQAGLTATGFSVHGGSCRAVLETIAEASGCWFAPLRDGLAMRAVEGAARAIADAGMGAGGDPGARGVRASAPADAAPRVLTIAHYDPARDYQAGVQRATRPGTGVRARQVELPAVIPASTAKAVAVRTLARLDTERDTRRVALGWDALTIAPGDRVTIDGEAGRWRVAGWSLERMAVALDLVRIASAMAGSGGSSGRVIGAPDQVHGPTLLNAFELPPVGDTPASAPRLAIAAAGVLPGWRSASLLLSTDGGATWSAIGGTRYPARIGTIVAPPRAAPATLEDRASIVEVELAHDAMTLTHADAAALDGGANLAWLGGELVQFAHAERIAARRWRLTGLWRGRRGTEARIGTQAPGDGFILLAADSLRVIDLPLGAVGTSVRVQAAGVGDLEQPAEAQAAIGGISFLPLAPVHLTAHLLPNGDTELQWIRRSRTGWRWLDGVDAPLGEESELYRVAVRPENADPRSIETGSASALVTAAERLAGAVTVEIRQVGAYGVSPPATVTLSQIMETL